MFNFNISHYLKLLWPKKERQNAFALALMSLKKIIQFKLAYLLNVFIVFLI